MSNVRAGGGGGTIVEIPNRERIGLSHRHFDGGPIIAREALAP